MSSREVHNIVKRVSGRYFITGGSGYLGRCLVTMLLEKGAEKVVVFDTRPSAMMAIVRDPRLQVVCGDIRFDIKIPRREF